MDYISALKSLSQLTLSTDSDCISDGVSIESAIRCRGNVTKPLWLQRLVQQAVLFQTVLLDYSQSSLFSCTFGVLTVPTISLPPPLRHPLRSRRARASRPSQPPSFCPTMGLATTAVFAFVARDHGNENINDIPDPLSALHRLVSKPLSLGQTYIQVANLLPHFWTMDEETNTLTAPCPRENPARQLRPRYSHGQRRWVALVLNGETECNACSRRASAILVMAQECQRCVSNCCRISTERPTRFCGYRAIGFEEIVVDEVAEAIELLHRDEPHAVVASLVVTGGCALNAGTCAPEQVPMPVYVPSSPGGVELPSAAASPWYPRLEAISPQQP